MVWNGIDSFSWFIFTIFNNSTDNSPFTIQRNLNSFSHLAQNCIYMIKNAYLWNDNCSKIIIFSTIALNFLLTQMDGVFCRYEFYSNQTSTNINQKLNRFWMSRIGIKCVSLMKIWVWMCILGWCYVRFLRYDDVKSYTRKW